MTKNIEITVRVIQTVIDGKLSLREAANLLETSVRTVHNHVKRYLEQGREGLVDHRRGNNHKLNPEIERQIVECKAQRSQRSAHWIRDWLKLDMSVEAVRLVLIKHHFTTGRINGSKRNVGVTPLAKSLGRSSFLSDFFHDEEPRAAERQPKAGISRAKSQSIS